MSEFLKLVTPDEVLAEEFYEVTGSTFELSELRLDALGRGV